jgi:hypothetical protein
MTMRYSHLMTEHLHLAMNKHRTPTGTNPGTTGTVSHSTVNGRMTLPCSDVL